MHDDVHRRRISRAVAVTIIRNVSNRLARLPFAAPAEPKIETIGLVSASKFAAEFGRRPCVAASLTHGTPSVELIIVTICQHLFEPVRPDSCSSLRLNVFPIRFGMLPTVAGP